MKDFGPIKSNDLSDHIEHNNEDDFVGDKLFDSIENHVNKIYFPKQTFSNMRLKDFFNNGNDKLSNDQYEQKLFHSFSLDDDNSNYFNDEDETSWTNCLLSILPLIYLLMVIILLYIIIWLFYYIPSYLWNKKHKRNSRTGHFIKPYAEYNEKKSIFMVYFYCFYLL